MNRYVCLLIVASLAAASASSSIREKLQKYTSEVDATGAPSFQAGFTDAVLGWTYPGYTDQCSAKLSSIVSDYFGILEDLFTLQFSNLQQRVQDLYTQYSAFPRCFMTTNVPTSVGVSLLYSTLLNLAGSSNVSGLINFIGFVGWLSMSPFMLLVYLPDKIFDYATVLYDTLQLLRNPNLDGPGTFGELTGGFVRVYLDGTLARAILNSTQSLY